MFAVHETTGICFRFHYRFRFRVRIRFRFKQTQISKPPFFRNVLEGGVGPTLIAVMFAVREATGICFRFRYRFRFRVPLRFHFKANSDILATAFQKRCGKRCGSDALCCHVCRARNN